jgi:hypothetical protein
MRGPSPAPSDHLNHRLGQVTVEALQQIEDRLPCGWTAQGHVTETEKSEPEKTEPDE